LNVFWNHVNIDMLMETQMARMKLTSKTLDALASNPQEAKHNIHDLNCKGLMVEVRPNGGMTYYLRYRDAGNRQRQFRLGSAEDLSLDQARKLVHQYRAQLAMGEDPAMTQALARQVPTLAEFVDEYYLPYVKIKKRSWETDASLLKNHILPLFGQRPMNGISKMEVVALHQGQLAAGAAPASANRLLILMRFMFNLARSWEIPGIERNPTEGIGCVVENNARERYLTRKEAERLVAAVSASKNPMLRPIVSLLLLTGARRGELLKAKWEDINLEQRLWRIPLSKSGKARFVPLSDGALQVLAALQAEQATWADSLRAGGWVVPNPDTGKPFGTIHSSWDRARKLAGLPEVRIHDLRHSFASFLVNNGRSIYEVQKILGHSQVRTTQRYAHLDQDSLLAAANTAAASLSTSFAPKYLATSKPGAAQLTSHAIPA
jgi:integrase